MKKKIVKKQSLYFMIPLIIVMVFIPLLVLGKQYNSGLNVNKWFSAGDSSIDFFLYYKSRAMMLMGLVMAFILGFVMYDRAQQKDRVVKKIWDLKIWIPAGVYGVFVLFSAILSEHSSVAFWGGFEQYEPALAILSYLITMLYAFYFINEARDINYMFAPILIGITIFSLIGLSQYLKIDFYKTEFAQGLLKMGDGALTNMNLNFTFEEGRVYGTVYNPNYVGTYVALLLPLLVGIIFATKKLWQRILAGCNVLMLIFCLIGSQSVTGYIGLAAAGVLFILLMIPHLKKYYVQALIFVGAVVVAGIFIFVFNKDALITVKNKLFHVQRMDYAVSSIAIDKDVTVNLANGKEVHILMTPNADNSDMDLSITDETGQEYERTTEQVTENDGTKVTGYKISPKGLNGIYVIPAKLSTGSNNEYVLGFRFYSYGAEWNFTNQYGDKSSYYIYNAFGKFDKIKTVDSIGFEGYNHFASRRGFIWSRTLPLLKDNIIVGVGSDNFVYAYPNDDYIGMTQNDYTGQVVTKPHNMYLQMAVQTGMISLIAFLCLVLVYIVQSIRYICKNDLSSVESKMAIAILIGVVGYLVCGLANDSTITVAPAFWAMLGIGLACNAKIKPEKQIEE